MTRDPLANTPPQTVLDTRDITVLAPSLRTVPAATRRVMQANRSRDTAPELAVRSRLHAMGLRYRVATPLPIDRRRRADIYFSRVGLYVFIDGCYWHGCPSHFVQPKTNVTFWVTKIAGNQLRDLDSTARLQALGFEVRRFWEHEDPADVAGEIQRQYLARVEGHGGGQPEPEETSGGHQALRAGPCP